MWWGEELIGGGGSAWCLVSAGWGADRGGRGIDGVNTAAPGLKEKACMCVCVREKERERERENHKK